ncbi:dCTP deaminase [Halorhabdus sp. CBA1104]|uniref:dCTP deaminase n=1 Tax=unclassified Halorhabdus TaxID=2621901 RepID=UPI0012B35918|nr:MULTISPECIES: dCTP deaminase [unclassified Halorhabdus]QGN06130.1 dCTP deaminase [Halorhabdus sp. CBA1104]
MTSNLTNAVEGIVYEPTQTDSPGLDLTVAEVYEVAAPGRVDFGGGELEAADLRAVQTTLHNSDDDYEWYHLDAGQYLVAFNESLTTTDQSYWLQTRDAVRDAGAFHPSLRVTDLDPVPLSVGGDGIRLKDNARVSTLLPL